MLLVPKVTAQTRTRQTPVTALRTETRERTVTTDEGEQVTQTYTVNVPVISVENTTYTTYVLGDVDRVVIPIKNVRAWHLDGSIVEAKDLASLCSKPIHVFAAEMPLDVQPDSVDPFFASLIRADALILYITPGAMMRSKSDNDQKSAAER